MKRSEPKPADASLARRARLQALLFQGAAVAAVIWTALPDCKFPLCGGE